MGHTEGIYKPHRTDLDNESNRNILFYDNSTIVKMWHIQEMSSVRE